METYRPSGAVPPLGALMTLTAGSLAAVILGVVYDYFVNWVPLIYFNIFATVFFGGLVGGAIGAAAHIGKVRNPALLVVFAVLCALLGLYVSWAFDPKVRFGAEFIAFDPDVLWSYIKFGYEKGFWSVGRLGQDGQNVSGIALAAVWLGEAAIIVAAAGSTAHFSGNQPFCEPCNRWTNTKEGVQTLANLANEDPRLVRVLEGDLSDLAGWPRPGSPEDDHLRLDLTTCPSCKESTFVSVTRVEAKTNSKGEKETTKQELVKHLVVASHHLPLVLDADRPVPGSHTDSSRPQGSEQSE